MDGQKVDQWRFHFTIARLLACTTFAALAAWTATVRLPITVTVSVNGERNILPLVLTSVLIAAAIGVLIKGNPGLAEGARIGCGMLIGGTVLASIAVGVVELVLWIV